MTKLEDTELTIKTIEELTKNGIGVSITEAMLMDIAKSLAIIADSMNNLKIENIGTLNLR